MECTWKMILWVMAQGVIPLGVCIMRPIFPLQPALPGSLLTHCLTLIMIAITGKIFSKDKLQLEYVIRLQSPPHFRYIGSQWTKIRKDVCNLGVLQCLSQRQKSTFLNGPTECSNFSDFGAHFQRSEKRNLNKYIIYCYIFPFLVHCAVFEGRCI